MIVSSVALVRSSHCRVTCSSKSAVDFDHLNNSKKLFVFGLGYTGIGLANYYTKRGWHVSGTCRSFDKLENLTARGFNVFQLDTDESQLTNEGIDSLNEASHIISTIPPDGLADPILDMYSSVLSSNSKTISWIGYISSTSVYGDYGGAWVDETSHLKAAQGKGYARAAVEDKWLRLYKEYNLPVHIFRCGGIYGPSRSALDAVRKQGPASRTQKRRGRQRYTARCHVLDICHVIEASINHPRPGGVYNVVDDDPASRSEVIAYAAQLLGKSENSTSSNENDDGSGSVSSLEEKRVRNELIKKELGVQLEFPTYREGLQALAKGDMRPF